jgi:hypothetical protein
LALLQNRSEVVAFEPLSDAAAASLPSPLLQAPASSTPAAASTVTV